MNVASVKSLKRKCFYALGIIALLSILGYLNLSQLIKSQEVSAAVINISGRQRMLSQKAALLSIQLVEGKDRQERQKIRKALSEVITLMEKAHNGLINGDKTLSLPGNLSPELKAIYYEPPDRLDLKMRTFIMNTRSLLYEPDQNLSPDNPHFKYILAASQGDLLHSIDKVVSEYQVQSESDIKKIQNFELFILLATLVVLFFEAMIIFRPIIRHIHKETKQLSDSNIKLQRLSTYDALTGIPNRRYFDEFITREWSRAARDTTWLALIMVDIDFFKNYNDTYGHQAGDDCLQQVAATLQDALKRPADLVARYGGEEFAVVLPGTDLKGAINVAEGLRERIETSKVPHSASQISEYVTVSLGVAATIPALESSSHSLINQADKSLYQAKREGRNRVCAVESIVTGAIPFASK